MSGTRFCFQLLFTNHCVKHLVSNKHIPEDYIINDVNTRLLVLAGLIDTDGSVENEGTTIAITQCYEHKQIIREPGLTRKRRIFVVMYLKEPLRNKSMGALVHFTQ